MAPAERLLSGRAPCYTIGSPEPGGNFMCLIIVGFGVHPQWPLLVAANRDEFHARETAPSAFWEDQPGLLAGRDLVAGGTWMGITRKGRFAAVTNYRDPARTAPAPRSRGELPTRFLAGTADPDDYLRELCANMQDYAGFNLLVGDSSSLWYLSNTAAARPQPLGPGIYGLSNARLDTPWPKVEQGKALLAELLRQGTPAHSELAAVVSDKCLAEPEQLHDHGLHGDMDLLLSAQFIAAGSYGTRCTTTIRAGATEISWRELSFDAEGRETARVRERFAPERSLREA